MDSLDRRPLTRLRSLGAAWIAALAVLLALAGQASAVTPSIQGQYLDYYSNGAGHFDSDFFEHHGGFGSGFFNSGSVTTGNADAGVSLAIYSSDTTATVYGVHSLGFQPYAAPHLLNPAATGHLGDPKTLISSYV